MTDAWHGYNIPPREWWCIMYERIWVRHQKLIANTANFIVSLSKVFFSLVVVVYCWSTVWRSHYAWLYRKFINHSHEFYDRKSLLNPLDRVFAVWLSAIAMCNLCMSVYRIQYDYAPSQVHSPGSRLCISRINLPTIDHILGTKMISVKLKLVGALRWKC